MLETEEGLRHGTPVDAGLDPHRLQAAWDLLDAWARDGSVPGATIAVARRGVRLSIRAFGSGAKGDDDQTMLPDRVFLVASVTKPVTAIAIMQLVERGLLSLTDPVQLHIPEFVGPGKERVRVEHLLTHTSSLPDMLPDNDALRARHAPLTEFVSQACRCEPSPGIRDDLTARATDVVLPDEQMGNDYHWNTNYWQHFGAPWGGMFSTVDDLLRLLATLDGGALQDGRILDAGTNRAMISDRTAAMPGLCNEHRRLHRWGLGSRLGARGDASQGSFSHGGATGTLVGADPDTGLSCAVS